jgi:hypothetical protein
MADHTLIIVALWAGRRLLQHDTHTRLRVLPRRSCLNHRGAGLLCIGHSTSHENSDYVSVWEKLT